MGSVEIGTGSPVLIAGPCLAESYDLCRTVAEELVRLSSVLTVPLVFKASFDKANRTGSGAGRGSGLEAGLYALSRIRSEFKIPVTTDVHTPDQCGTVAAEVDLIQIPAFLCRQTDLLAAAAETGRPVNVKKGQFLAPWDAKNIVDKLRVANASGILLTERGTSFGYNNLVVDMPGIVTMRSFGVPVCFDATHSAQRPGSGGDVTGGARETIPYLAAAAAAVGIDALFMEVHPNPDVAISDAATQWPLAEAEPLLRKTLRIWRASAGLAQNLLD